MELKEIRKKIKDVKGPLDPSDEKFLFDQAKKLKPGSIILEIGAFRGRSTLILGLAAPKCKVYTIDIKIRKELISNIRKHSTNINIVEGDSKAVLWDRPVDLLWIDGDHKKTGIENDIKRYSSWVKVEGTICGHDYGDKRYAVTEIVDDEIKGGKKWENFNTVGVCWVATRIGKFEWPTNQERQLNWWKEKHPSIEEIRTSGANKQKMALANFKVDRHYFTGKSVLDVGCGPLSVLRDVPCRQLIAVEPLMYELHRHFPSNRDERGVYLCSRGESIPLMDESVDIVWCVDVLDQCDSPKDVAKEISRIIKPEGKCLLMVRTTQKPYPFHRVFTEQEILDMFGLFRVDSKQSIIEADNEPSLYTILRRTND